MKKIKNEPIKYENRITFPAVETIAKHFNISVEKAQDLHDNNREKYNEMINQFYTDCEKAQVQKSLELEESLRSQNQAMKESANKVGKHIYDKHGKFAPSSQDVKSRKPIDDDFELTM